ncbi:MAG: phosphatase PAP2 family protein [Elusimicrobia bacterium]|nr:phosphatase PAP2 family protein [Elusimicrobiota bacterium]MDE2312741.1 phosphatase PAP2 family protein [Elusimicrobiota bacterium]
MKGAWTTGLLAFALAAGAGHSAAAAGMSFIDRRVHEDTSGVWAAAKSPDFPAGLTAAAALGAFWEGGNNRLGKTLWQCLDADALSGVTTQALKLTFQRERPTQTSDPNEWFKGPHSQSFPSGDVSTVTSLVTPLILEYHDDHPSVYALTALPIFDMAARMKAHAHWQSDVLAGAAVGAISGYLVRKLKTPFILSIMPNGVAAGLRYRFR